MVRIVVFRSLRIWRRHIRCEHTRRGFNLHRTLVDSFLECVVHTTACNEPLVDMCVLLAHPQNSDCSRCKRMHRSHRGPDRLDALRDEESHNLRTNRTVLLEHRRYTGPVGRHHRLRVCRPTWNILGAVERTFLNHRGHTASHRQFIVLSAQMFSQYII